jgi:hypothetical protein
VVGSEARRNFNVSFKMGPIWTCFLSCSRLRLKVRIWFHEVLGPEAGLEDFAQLPVHLGALLDFMECQLRVAVLDQTNFTLPPVLITLFSLDPGAVVLLNPNSVDGLTYFMHFG